MESARSIVWLGDERMAVELAAECPALEVVWERDLACARALGCADFDAIVLACDNATPALEALAELRARGPLPPAFVLLDCAGEPPLEDLRA
ncbi:MAG TPA: hypothetical protein VEC18_02130, partial [Myxococcota bacterium]|nr:hypothetical protein [Myxococcota bacterium]